MNEVLDEISTNPDDDSLLVRISFYLLIVFTIFFSLFTCWKQTRIWRARSHAPVHRPPTTEELRALYQKKYTPSYSSVGPSQPSSSLKVEEELEEIKPTPPPPAPPTQLPIEISSPLPAIVETMRRWQPVDSVQELFSWTGPEFSVASQCAGIPPRRVRTHDNNNKEVEKRLMVVHDMAGNYLEDACVDGWWSRNKKSSHMAWGFRIQHFAWIDTFVYFSHHFLSIPPAGWISAGHVHGTKVLGTLLTEYEKGYDQCKQLFDTKEHAVLAATKLSAMCTLHRFEGWLINIENKVDVEWLPNILVFLTTLSELCNNQVVWYDSIVFPTGLLEWQNGLTDKNFPFFTSSQGGILTNYGWTPEQAEQSCHLAGNSSGLVWHGIDVFGRGTLGGGGLHCNVPLKALECQVNPPIPSAACLFAPGWVVEEWSQGKASLGRTHSLQFWHKVLSNTNTWGYNQECPRIILHLTKQALFTDFCDGGGTNMFASGALLTGAQWLDLRRQTLQPRWDVFTPKEAEHAQERITCKISTDLAFLGNVSVQISGRRSGLTNKAWCFFPVLAMEARLGGDSGPSSKLRITVPVYRQDLSDVALSLTISSKEEGQEPTVLILTPQSDERGLSAIREVVIRGWTLRTWEISTYPYRSRKLLGVGVSALPIPVKREHAWMDARLGFISLDETGMDPSRCVPQQLRFHASNRLLTWMCACGGNASCTSLFAHVFVNAKFQQCAFGRECVLPQDALESQQQKCVAVRAIRWDGSESDLVEFDQETD